MLLFLLFKYLFNSLFNFKKNIMTAYFNITYWKWMKNI